MRCVLRPGHFSGSSHRRSTFRPNDGKPSPYFGEYPSEFFDFIVIDECHRGGDNDETN